MTCVAIITEDGIDQIIECGEAGEYRRIVKREKADLIAMGCNVRQITFLDEATAYAWEAKKRDLGWF